MKINKRAHLSVSVFIVHLPQVPRQVHHHRLVAVENLLFNAPLLEADFARAVELAEVQHGRHVIGRVEQSFDGIGTDVIAQRVDPAPALVVGVHVGDHEVVQGEVRQLCVCGSHGVCVHLRQQRGVLGVHSNEVNVRT